DSGSGIYYSATITWQNRPADFSEFLDFVFAALLASQMPIVLASRTHAGEVLWQTYGFRGSESDLLAWGLISAGPLDGFNARILLTLLLAGGVDPLAGARRPG